MRRALLAALWAAALAACTAGSGRATTSAAGVAGVTALPRVLLLDARALAETRDAVRAGSDVAGLAALLHEADAVATTRPMTVTSKSTPGPSGDLHDYVSLSIYWWPDPATPDGLPYIQRDGHINPASSDVRTYDASKLNRMVSAVETLALAAYVTGDAKYAEASATWLRTWFIDPTTRMNPAMTYAQIIPGHNEPRGTGIIDSRQFIRAIDAALLLEGSPSWTRSDDAALRAWFSAFAEWLVMSTNGKLEAAAKNNHGTWYDAQLADVALYGGRDDIAKDTLARFGARRVATQIGVDGTQALEVARTRSYHYSAFNLLAFSVAADLGPWVGIDIWHGTGPGIRTALDLLGSYASGGRWPYPDIDQVDYYLELAPTLARAAHAYPDAGYDRLLAQLGVKATAAEALRLRLGAFGSLGGTAAAPAPLVPA